MAPQAASEVAGTEWYDSGIGFAVPLTGLTDRFEKMKKGEDQRPGPWASACPRKIPTPPPPNWPPSVRNAPAGQAG